MPGVKKNTSGWPQTKTALQNVARGFDVVDTICILEMDFFFVRWRISGKSRIVIFPVVVFFFVKFTEPSDVSLLKLLPNWFFTEVVCKWFAVGT